MSEAPLPIDDEEACYAELAGLDMALARHVNAQALATTDPDTPNGLVRSAQRLARSVRQTLAMKAKLVADRATAASRAATWAPPRDETPRRYGALSDMLDLETAVLPRIRAEYDPSELEPLEEDLSEVISDVWTDLLADLPLGDQVERLLDHIRDTYFEDIDDADAADEDSGDAAPVAEAAPACPERAVETAPEAAAEPAPPPEPDPPPTPPEPWQEPYIPPWERNPYARYPGGSGY